jgi:hypothetical protein
MRDRTSVRFLANKVNLQQLNKHYYQSKLFFYHKLDHYGYFYLIYMIMYFI